MLMGLLGPQIAASNPQPKKPGMNESIMGLLGNPMFTAGMGLLSAGRDSRVDPYQAALSGMNSAQQIRWMADEKKRAEEMAKARKAYMEAQTARASRPERGRGVVGSPIKLDNGNLAYLDGDSGQIVDTGQPFYEERFAPQMIGGVPHTFNQQTGMWEPGRIAGQTATPSQVGEMKGAVDATAAGVVADAERSRTQQSPEYQQSLSDLRTELNWIKNNKDDFLSIFGPMDAVTPDIRESAKTANAKRERVASLLTLAARGALKGQGQISDFESKLLERAATLLNDRGISDKAAWSEVERLEGVLSGKEQAAGMPTESDGWGIVED